ncbi:MAG: DUF6111 family protein [Hyphomicrobiaceae bacterium]
MIRVILENIILFLLPTLIYIAFAFARRNRQSTASASQIFDDAPVIWLLVAGAVCMVAGLAYFGSTSGGRPGEQYQPPVYRDGKIIPGHYK